MSQVREPEFDRAVGLVLRIGAFGCFFIMLAGLIAGLFVSGHLPLDIERAGVLLMLATPVVGVLVDCVLFFREKDWKYGWFFTGVLLVLLDGFACGVRAR